MKNILVLLHDDPGQEARLQAALDLTRGLDGHLTCIDICQPPPPSAPAAAYGMVEVDGVLLEEAQTLEQANRATIEHRLGREDVSWSMASMTGDIATSIAEQVGLADLLVLNRRLDDFFAPDMLGITSKLVLKVRKPIVAVPQGLRRFDVAGTAVVAWDGSSSAMAALTTTVPLLGLAEQVVLVEIDPPSTASIEDAAAYLSRHGIHAEVEVSSGDKARTQVVDLIQSTCRARGAAYCVMGAYGHSRLREAMFGGVTRSMLKTSDIPLVIAH